MDYLSVENKIKSLVDEVYSLVEKNPPKNSFTVFLCGGSGKKQSSFRFSLGKAIEDTKNQNNLFSVYYPETLFAEFLYGYSKRNLLEMENILAENVDSIVIPLESPGTFCELGAFSNSEKLRNRMILICLPQYAANRSFINDGPVALIKSIDRDHVLVSSLESDCPDEEEKNINNIKNRVREQTMRIKKGKESFQSPLFLMTLFLFFLIYVFDPIKNSTIQKIISECEKLDNNQRKLIGTSIGILGTNGFIRMNSNSVNSNKEKSFSITEKGFKTYLRRKGYSTTEIWTLQVKIDNLRIQALNLTYRGKNPGGGMAAF